MLKRVAFIVPAGLLAALQSAHAAEPDGLRTALALEQAVIKAVAEAESSIVSIARINVSDLTREADRFDPFRPGLPDPERRNATPAAGSPDFVPNEFGAGIILASESGGSERFILTNYHLVKGGPVFGQPPRGAADRLYVQPPGRAGFYAGIFAADPRSDLAVLKVDFERLAIRPADLKPLQPARNADFRKGQFVVTLGNPYAIARDGSASAAWGMIANVSRRPAPPAPPDESRNRESETVHHFGTLLHITAPLNLGTTGGAVINLKGELIGITTSLAALDGYEKSVGYAVPFDAATRRIVETLMKGHEVEYGFLGVFPQDVSPAEMRQLARRFRQTSAAKVAAVSSNSPANDGGLTHGDVILAVDGKPVYDRYDLMRHVGLLGPETEASLRVWRESARRELNLTVRLGKWPVHDDDGIIASVPRHQPWRGIAVDYPTARHKHLQYPFRYHAAVVVTNVEHQSARGPDNLRPGDFITHVNDVAVRTPAEFFRAVRPLARDVTLRLADDRRVTVPN